MAIRCFPLGSNTRSCHLSPPSPDPRVEVSPPTRRDESAIQPPTSRGSPHRPRGSLPRNGSPVINLCRRGDWVPLRQLNNVKGGGVEREGTNPYCFPKSNLSRRKGEGDRRRESRRVGIPLFGWQWLIRESRSKGRREKGGGRERRRYRHLIPLPRFISAFSSSRNPFLSIVVLGKEAPFLWFPIVEGKI